MRSRKLLIVLACCLAAAASVGVVFANPTGSATALPSASVGVTSLQNLGGYLVNHDSVVPANNTPQRMDDVWAFEGDPDYAVEAVSAVVTSQGLATLACTGLSANRFSFVPTFLPTGDLIDGPVGAKIGELKVTIPPTVGNGCVVGGAVLTITFQAVVGPDL